ncbi:MAG: 23S rRNA (adenine(2503)-C(2))-methyltransferase RlmN [Terriglobia bacterium]|jgi:23S rRNA (adenine2503-C2)-methyltransferase
MNAGISGHNLVGLDRQELERLVQSLGKAPYHGRQLYHALYHRRERDVAALTDLDRNFREALAAHYEIAYPDVQGEFISKDGSARYLLRLQDNTAIETVYMPEEERITLCLSSQAGCAVDCRFCFTALLGLKRNLSAGEILGQVLAVAKAREIPPRSRLNLVFMGMGEPLLNLAQVMKAIRIFADPQGLGIPLRRITISTSGIVPGVRDLARDPRRPKLAISLNASNEQQRTELMPINRKYQLRELMRACRAYPLRPRERLTFEYVLLGGFNDTDADAVRVADLLRGMRTKVNLIPYNPGPELPYRPSPLERVLAFQQLLTERNIPAYIRISRGQDIGAACGQLRLEGMRTRHPSAPIRA